MCAKPKNKINVITRDVTIRIRIILCLCVPENTETSLTSFFVARPAYSHSVLGHPPPPPTHHYSIQQTEWYVSVQWFMYLFYDLHSSDAGRDLRCSAACFKRSWEEELWTAVCLWIRIKSRRTGRCVVQSISNKVQVNLDAVINYIKRCINWISESLFKDCPVLPVCELKKFRGVEQMCVTKC